MSVRSKSLINRCHHSKPLKIDDYAFADNRMDTLALPTDSALEEIGEYAFVDNNLTLKLLPVSRRRAGAIQNNLTSVTFNEELKPSGRSLLNNLTEAIYRVR